MKKKQSNSFISFDNSFSLPCSSYDINLGEYFNCSYTDIVSKVLTAMDETLVPPELISKYGKGIKRKKLINLKTDDDSGLGFIQEFIENLNDREDNESYWQILYTRDEEEEISEYLNSLIGILSEDDVHNLKELAEDERFDYVFFQIQYFHK